MSNLLERIICDYKTLAQIRECCQCKHCKTSSTLNMAYFNNCHYGVYCKKCILSLQCGQCIGNEKPIPALYSLIQLARFKCSYYAQGCKSELTYDMLQNHEQSCNYSTSNASIPFKYTPFIPKSEKANYYQGYSPISPQPLSNFSEGNEPLAQLCLSSFLSLGINSLEGRLDAIELAQKADYTKLIDAISSKTENGSCVISSEIC